MISALNYKIGGGGAACQDATVKNSDNTYNTTTPSGSVLTLPNISVTDSDGSTSSVPAVKNFTCKPIPVGATLLKTGQTTSYRTGDDGDLERGRPNSFTALPSNNPFGNNNRFTDTAGGTTYANNIVIDWSTFNGTTVNGWYRLAMPTVGTYTWNQAIDNALAFTIGTFTTGWRLANVAEYFSIFNWGNTPANKLNYAPFSLVGDFWSSTTTEASVNAYYVVNSTTLHFFTTGKTAGIKALFVRTFNVSGTTLT